MNDKPVILVVDDKPQNIELIEAYLSPEGYEIVKASNGREAMGKLSSEQIDMVLLDVIMPGMNGYEVCRRIKANPKTAALPVLLLTSLHQRENMVDGMNAGADDFITKPIEKDDLILLVRNAVRGKRLYDEKQAASASVYDKGKEWIRD